MIKLSPLFFLLILLGCAGNQLELSENAANQLTSFINPPLEGDFVNRQTYHIDPTIENKLEAPNGSSFTIPAKSIVNANGEILNEEITITFDQYHSTIDILTSGIPMTYDTLGETYTFQSAGMFTLEAQTTTSNEPVFVKEGAAIDMNLASDKSDEQPFNFYEINPETRDWTFEPAASTVRLNPRFDPENYTPPAPEPVSEDAFVLDINFDLSNYEELSVFSGIVWEYTGTHDSLDPRKSKLMHRQRWTNFELEPTHEVGYEYYLTMSNNLNQFTTRVKAALDGEDMEAAIADFQTKKIAFEKKKDDLQKPFIRSVQIDGFGTYNYDYIYKVDQPQIMAADFDFKNNNDLKDHALIVVIYEEDDVVVNYPKTNWDKFGLNGEKDAKIMAILPGNQVAVCTDDITQSYGKSKHTFQMQVLDQTVESKADLVDVIASI